MEAGKSDRERILPYMPGPLTQVDEDITGKEKLLQVRVYGRLIVLWY